MKRCTACGLNKPLDDFYPDPRRSDGRRAKCRACFPRCGGKPSAQQRAAGKRRRGEATGPYLTMAQIRARAIARRIELHDGHVQAWRKPPLHDAHVRAFKSPRVRYARKYSTDPAFATHERMRNQLKKKAKLFPKLCDLMRRAICRHGGSSMVERVCGYTVAQLVAHLESQFTDGMTWARFADGDIHIDHRRPQRLFGLSSEEDVRACWALTNLQPLWASDNLAKGARLNWQPRVTGSSAAI